MKSEQHKPIRKEEPKRKGNIGRLNKRLHAVTQEKKPITSPQLREAYSTKIEWAKKLVPKLKKEEAQEGKEKLG